MSSVEWTCARIDSIRCNKLSNFFVSHVLIISNTLQKHEHENWGRKIVERLQRQQTLLIVTFTYQSRTRLPTFTSFVDLLSNRKSLIVTRSKASMNGWSTAASTANVNVFKTFNDCALKRVRQQQMISVRHKIFSLFFSSFSAVTWNTSNVEHRVATFGN